MSVLMSFDLVAVYGAALSTILALVAFWVWWFRDLHLTVHGFHQQENWLGSGGSFGFAVSNSGRRPTVVRKVRIRFVKRKGLVKRVFDEANFDQSTLWNPAAKDVPIEGKPNHTRVEPRVLYPGEELHGIKRPVSTYQPEQDWILVSAYARGSNRIFSDWIAPMKNTNAGEN